MYEQADHDARGWVVAGGEKKTPPGGAHPGKE